MRKYICEGLAEYLSKSYKPWHMPGHKRKNFIDEKDGEAADKGAASSALPYDVEMLLNQAMSMDVTEVPGTDDLHHPEEMILKSQQQLAEIYRTYASYYLINGSTCGILSAIGAVAAGEKGNRAGQTGDAEERGVCEGEKHIIIARNCHKSVYNAVELFGLTPHYINPEYLTLEGEKSHIYGGICPQQLKSLVEEYPDVCAVVITSPTYEGVLSDVAEIKRVLEPYGIPLIVDEAHGAHLPFMDNVGELPPSAITLGADIVVQSLHKTLPSLTQTAILHVNNKAFNQAIKKYLSIFMSSSPSYIMLCSMEQAVVGSWEKKEQGGYREYLESLREFRQQLSGLKCIKLLDMNQCEASALGQADRQIFAYDDTRIVLYSSVSGEYLAERLRALGNIEIEMSGVNYVVLISTYADTPEDFEHLEKTIKLVDAELESSLMLADRDTGKAVAEIFSTEYLHKLVGTYATDNIYVYPPGSYIVVAGEEISQAAVDKIIQLKASGKRIIGLKGE